MNKPFGCVGRIFHSDEYDHMVLTFARIEKNKRDLELRTRIRKKLKCCCGTIVNNSDEFQRHCEEVIIFYS